MVAAGEALGSSGLSDSERRELAASIAGEGARLTRLIEKLLDLSRLQAGTATPRRDWCSLEEVIRAAAEGTGAKLSLDADLPLIEADSAQLERAFANLLENAVRHSGGRPVSVRARVTGGRLLVRVVDQGPGIAPSEQERIFEPFYGTTGSASAWRSSRASSRPTAAGCTSSRCPARAPRSSSRSRCRWLLPHERILVCDDEPQILRALKVILREAGFEAVPAETAEQALDRAAVRPPDAAIIDLVLPDGDGIEVCRKLREWSEMPILVLSALGEEDEKVRALEAGADDYVTKPFGARELIARLNAALRRVGRGPDEPAIRVDGLELDLAARTVRVDGAEVHLTPIEFDLLRTLARNRGRLMTHRALLVEVWGREYATDTQILRTHIANLRRKIGSQYVRTDPGVGYRLLS